MTVTIWHNPRCSKSRRALALIEEQGHEPEIVEYLENPPSIQQLKELSELLGKGPGRIYPQRRERFTKQLELKGSDDQTLFAAMSGNPILIERAIVFANGKAVIGRPPEDVLEIL